MLVSGSREQATCRRDSMLASSPPPPTSADEITTRACTCSRSSGPRLACTLANSLLGGLHAALARRAGLSPMLAVAPVCRSLLRGDTACSLPHHSHLSSG